MSRIQVYIGHFGSGKTEISLHMALKMAKAGQKVTLVDLDNVNPYFRSGEQKPMLEAAGIRVLMPTFEGTTVDVPSLPANIHQVFVDRERQVIFDVGGDPTGAGVLGRYHPQLEAENAHVTAVINTLRPWTQNVEDILWILEDMSRACKLPISGLAHNTNLARETTPEQVLAGQKLAEEASRRSGIPIESIFLTEGLSSRMPKDFIEKNKSIIREIHPYMRPDWLDETR